MIGTCMFDYGGWFVPLHFITPDEKTKQRQAKRCKNEMMPL